MGLYVITIRRSENSSSGKESLNTFGRSRYSREESNAVVSDSTPNVATTSCAINQTPQQAGALASSLMRKVISLTEQKRSTDHQAVSALLCTPTRAIQTAIKSTPGRFSTPPIAAVLHFPHLPWAYNNKVSDHGHTRMTPNRTRQKTTALEAIFLIYFRIVFPQVS